MTWAEFHEFFMGKYFPTTARYAKAQEFLELKQRAMIVMEYVARFTKLAHFADNYVAINTAKVRKFENKLRLSIRGRIVGLRLQDMASMVGTTMTIEREIEDAWSTRDAGASGKRKESQSSSSSGKKKKASSSCGFQSRGHPGQRQIRVASQARQMVCFNFQQLGHMRRDCPKRQGLGFRDSAVPVSSGIGADTVYSSTPYNGSGEPVSVSGRCTSTSCYTGRLERPSHGPRQRTRPIGRDVRDLVACLCHHITG